jgi:hypothetical protein
MSDINYLIFTFKYIFRVIHVFSFAMLFGNVSYDLFMSPRSYPADPYSSTFSALSITFYVLIMISGVANMILLILEKKFIKDFHLGVWKKSIILKFILTIFITPALEGLISLGVSEENKITSIAIPIRFSIMLIILLGSSFLRYYREYFIKSEYDSYLK